MGCGTTTTPCNGVSEFPILSYGPTQPQEQCPGRDYVSDSPCNISTMLRAMNELEWSVNLLTSRWTIEGTSIVLGGYIPRKLTSESSGLFCQSRVTASRLCIVLLSMSTLIQEAPNSASSSRVSPTATTRDAFRLSRRRGFERKTVWLASVRH